MEKEASRLERDHVHSVYEKIAPYFNDKRYKAWPKVQKFILAQESGSLIADIGCGNGKYLHINSQAFKVGCDNCFPLAAAARNHGYEIMACDGLSLPYRTGCFDAVLSIAVIHHFSTKERRLRAIQEMARILRIGGQIMIYVWAMEQKTRKFEKQDVFVPWNLELLSSNVSTESPKKSMKPHSRNLTSNKYSSSVHSTLDMQQKAKSHSFDHERENSEKSFEKSVRLRFLSRSLDSGLDVNNKCTSNNINYEGGLSRFYDYCIQFTESTSENPSEKGKLKSLLRHVGRFFPKYMQSVESNTIQVSDALKFPLHSINSSSSPNSAKQFHRTETIENYSNVPLPDLVSNYNGQSNKKLLKSSCIKNTDLVRDGDKSRNDEYEKNAENEMSAEHQLVPLSESGECLRYYHIFKKGELTELIEQYIPELHVVQTYFDHSNWCVVAEKIQLWTI
ncbi:hypothetical protein FKM82_009619 [Ascaphus truei]|uniref:putative tRNA methyltransferase 9B n=1 Tax=Ascaphus truei TaxID=8439 RepID=UPI003F5ACA2C